MRPWISPMGMCLTSLGTAASAISQSSRTSSSVRRSPLPRRSRNSRGVISFTMLEHELLGGSCIDQRFHDGFEQTFADPLVAIDPAPQNGVHPRRLADDGEKTPADGERLFEARVVHRQRTCER